MPDFSARVTTPATTAAVAESSTPPRLNPNPGHPYRHVRVALADTSVVASATVAGVEGELDANLGGRLFSWWVAERPPSWQKSLPPITTPGGQSSVATLAGFPAGDADALGHWVLMARRPDGGGVMLPFDVES